jgi:nucleotide-binding universal stress UspA family protein
MTEVLAAIDNSLAARPVLIMARALAEVLGADVAALHVDDENDGGQTALRVAESLGIEYRQCGGDPLSCICEAAGRDDVVGVVIGARRDPVSHHTGHLAGQVADAVDKPVVVVPPDADPTAHLHRVVIAMEGSRHKSKALKSAVEVAAGADLDLTVVHVDDETSIPSFSDHAAYDAESYAHEFLARYLVGAPDAHLELRIGTPTDAIIDVTDGADLLAIGWPQHATAERGAVAHELLDRSHVPVLLIALDEREGST